MLNVVSWFQNNWLDAIMLLATLVAVIATIVAVRIAVLALAVARKTARSADDAHERNVRLQARNALVEAQSSYGKLATACSVNEEKWRAHRWTIGPALSAPPFHLTPEIQETSEHRRQGAIKLREAEGMLQAIDQMALAELEFAIPSVRQATSEIDELRRCLPNPRTISID